MNYLKRLLDFNSSRYRLWQENAAFAALVPDGALVLDAGAGDAPYKSLFQHARYESADFEKSNRTYVPSTYICDLQHIPTEDGRFDFIVFNQVMEHLPEPKLVLAELYRVLKPGGKMIYTGPLFYEEHEQPYDFYRYTQFGLRYLFDSAGYVIERLDWLEGYFGTVGYQLNTHGALPSSQAKGYRSWATRLCTDADHGDVEADVRCKLDPLSSVGNTHQIRRPGISEELCRRCHEAVGEGLGARRLVENVLSQRAVLRSLTRTSRDTAGPCWRRRSRSGYGR